MLPEGWKATVDSYTQPYIKMATDYIQAKPETLITIGVSVAGLVLVPLIKNHFQQQAQIAQEKAASLVTTYEQANQQLSTVNTQQALTLESAQAKLKEYEENDLASLYNEAKETLQIKDFELSTLKREFEDLNVRYVNLAQSKVVPIEVVK